MAHFVDIVFCIAALVLPPVLVLGMRRWGVLCGTIANWGLGVAAGEAVRRLDPASRNPFAAMNDHLWFWGGWVLGLVYCFPFWLMKGWVGQRKAAKDAARERAG